MTTRAALRKLATAMSDGPTVRSRHRVGMVASVVAGAAADGNAAVTVTVGATSLVAPYLDSYSTPAVGDLVMVLLNNGSPLILGRVIGLPSF